MTTFEEFVNYCDTVICEEKDYERYVKENLSDFISFYSGSWKDLFEAVLSLNSSDIDLEKFSREGQLLKLKIAAQLGLRIDSSLAEIAALNSQLPILQFLKENNIYVSLPFIFSAIRKPNFRLIKFLDTNNLFEYPTEVANEIVRSGRVELLKGLKIKPTISVETKEKQSLWEKYKEELIPKFQQDSSIDFDISALSDLPPKFNQADPESGKNVEWLIQSYLGGGISLYEDLVSQVRPAIEEWLYLKRAGYITKNANPLQDYTTLINICGVRGCEMRRRGKMQGLPGLYEIMKPFENILMQKREQVLNAITNADYKEIWSDNNFRVIQPLTEKGSCYYGAGTKWCTAGKHDNQFNTYNEQGPLYIIIPKSPTYVGEKYQLHIETDSLMNELDESVSIKKLLNKHPNIINVPIIKFYIDLKDAIKNNNTEKVIELSNKLPTNKALNYALENDIIILIENLLKSELKISKKNSILIFDILHEEARKGNINILKFVYLLIQNNKEKNKSIGYNKETGEPLFNEYIAAEAAYGNQLEVLKWLYSLNPPIKLHHWAIRTLMEKNRLSILEWLSQVDPKILLDDMGLYYAVQNGNLDVLKLVHKIKPEFVVNDKWIKLARENNRENILEWYSSLGAI